MNNAPLAAVHRVEVKWPARLLYFFGRGDRAQAQFFNPQHPVIVGIEAQSRMMLGRHAERFHGEKLHRQHQFSFIRQQQIHVRARELHQQVRIFQIRMQMLALENFVFDIEIQMVEYHVQEILNAGPRQIDGVLLVVHVSQPLDFFFAAILGTSAGGGVGMLLLTNHCCKIPTKLLVNQYNTRPLDIL